MHQPPPAAPPAPTITLMRLAPAAPTQAPTQAQTPTPTPTPAAPPAPTHSDETRHHSLPRSSRVEYGLFNVVFN